MPAPTATDNVLESYRFVDNPFSFDSFESGNGFGPFTVQRRALRKEILTLANPVRSIHISGSKASGKTILLKLLGKDLLAAKKRVYLFKHSGEIDKCSAAIQRIIAEKEEAYFLIDETQANANSPVFTYLLKNDEGHRATTIGAGVPSFESASGSFARSFRTDRLFLSQQEVVSEGLVDYFVGESTPTVRSEIENLIWSIRDYTGGHVFPLMRLSELLVKRIKQESFTADQAKSHLNSSQFRSSEQFTDLSQRIIPSLRDVDIRVIFYPRTYELSPAMVELQKRGFCDNDGKVMSTLLIDIYLSSVRSDRSAPLTTLSAGLQGVQELLTSGAPQLSWEHYEVHGGAVEDALTFELLRSLSHVKPLGVMLFNPKLVMAATSGRRPDIYFNSTVHCYVKCVLTKANTQTARKDVEKHILRFFRVANSSSAHYEIQDADFAILHYQDWGSAPMQLEDVTCRQCFNERVYTFLMKASPPQLYLGNTPLLSC